MSIVVFKYTSCGGSRVGKASNVLWSVADFYRCIMLDYFWTADEPRNYLTSGVGPVYWENVFERRFFIPRSVFDLVFSFSMHRS